MHFIVTSNGSYGDVHPFFGIAHALAARGHDVDVVSNPLYADLAGDLSFVPASDEQALARVIDQFSVKASMKTVGPLMHGLLVEPLRPFHEVLMSLQRPGETVVVAFPLVTAARLLHDQLGTPFVSCQLAPSAMRSALDSPRFSAGTPAWLPPFVVRAAMGLLDRYVDRFVKADVNAYRAELELPPTRGIFSWMDSPQKVLGLFPDWFGPSQPDWPTGGEASAFPLFDGGEANPLSAEIEAFLASGEPPIVFTAGSPAQGVGHFYASATAACLTLGRRGLLLTRYPEDVPPLPDGVQHATYAPFGALLPRIAALVHHGGIGTCAQALRAGTPQLLVPWGMDQFDNSKRVQAQGGAREVPFVKVTADRLATALQALLDDPSTAEACSATAARFEGADPAGAACDALERFAHDQLGG